MENGYEGLYMGIGAFMFVIAVSFLFFTDAILSDICRSTMLNESKDNVIITGDMYE